MISFCKEHTHVKNCKLHHSRGKKKDPKKLKSGFLLLEIQHRLTPGCQGTLYDERSFTDALKLAY